MGNSILAYWIYILIFFIIVALAVAIVVYIMNKIRKKQRERSEKSYEEVLEELNDEFIFLQRVENGEEEFQSGQSPQKEDKTRPVST